MVDIADTLRKRAVATLVFALADVWVLLTTVAEAPVLVAALAVPAGLHCFWGAQAAAAAQHWALAWEKKVALQKSAAINKVMRMAKLNLKIHPEPPGWRIGRWRAGDSRQRGGW